MKQLFAIFCAIVLLPSFSSYAWIGGPFSNNTYFGENGDDGVYEAVGTTTNGVGIFRWGVTNTLTGVDSSLLETRVTSVAVTVGGVTTTTTTVFVDAFSSNVYFGGIGRISHSWFLEGVAYEGNCYGTVNSGLGFISCVGTADEADGTGGSISSSFTAEFDDRGDGLPVRRFSGRGNAAVSAAPNTLISFIVFGSKVFDQVNYGNNANL